MRVELQNFHGNACREISRYKKHTIVSVICLKAREIKVILTKHEWNHFLISTVTIWLHLLIVYQFISRVNSVLKCATVANDKGFKYFAVRNGGECLADDKLRARYKDHRVSQECFEGEGGHEAINVYNITGKCRKKKC